MDSNRASARQEAVGLPAAPLLGARKLYDPRSGCLILACGIENRHGISTPQIYVRDPATGRYEDLRTAAPTAVQLTDEDLAFESPVLGSNGQLYCLVSTFGRKSSAGHVPVNSLGILALHLGTRRALFWPTGNEFFVTELVGSDDSEIIVYGVVGRRVPISGGARVEYSLAALDFRDRTLSITSELATPFF